jgi:hypothetical protein
MWRDKASIPHRVVEVVNGKVARALAVNLRATFATSPHGGIGEASDLLEDVNPIDAGSKLTARILMRERRGGGGGLTSAQVISSDAVAPKSLAG